LEREHRLTRFQRQGRRLALTDSGLAVVAAARRALDAIDEVTATARRLASEDELVVVATPTNSALLSPIVTRFVRHHPSTALRLLRAGSMSEVIAMVAAGVAELGFGDLSADHGQHPVQVRPLWHAEAALVSPVGRDLPDAVPQEVLGALQLVLPRPERSVAA
jgi:DNA-binding transcriptional LysR family regulator